MRSNGRDVERNRPPRPLPSPRRAAHRRPSDTLPLRSPQALPSISGRADGPGRRLRARRRALLIIAAQAQLDGTRWQVIPPTRAAVTCTAMGTPVASDFASAIAYRTIAAAGAAGAALSTAAGLAGLPHAQAGALPPARPRAWIDRARRSWLLKTRRRRKAAPPEHRMMMANVWYPAADANPKNRRDTDELASKSASESIQIVDARSPTLARGRGGEGDVAATSRRRERPRDGETPGEVRARLRAAAVAAGARRIDGTSTGDDVAESLELRVGGGLLPSRQDGGDDGRARRESSPFERHDDGEGQCRGFPLVLFSHSFTGVKGNSALLQELASWGVVVAVDHPHDAALVLYLDGSTADFRGYDMPRELEPRNWWRFRHEHAAFAR